MKRILSPVAGLILGAVLASGALAQSALNEILDSGVLKFGTTGDFNPMSVRDPATNSYKGFDIDMASELAKDMGVEIEFVPTDWKTLVNGVVAGKYHLSGSASIAPGRMKVAGYSETYLSADIYPFTTEDKADRFDGWDSVNNAEVKVSTTLGTTFHDMVKEWFPNAELMVVEAPARGFQEVLAGRADVFITSNIEGATLTAKFPVVRIKNTGPRNPAALAMLMPQADQVWINYVNNWIKIKQLTGFFDSNKAKWGL